MNYLRIAYLLGKASLIALAIVVTCIVCSPYVLWRVVFDADGVIAKYRGGVRLK